MTAAWPNDVNQGVERDGYQEAPERNVAQFQVEVGGPKERPRMSIAMDAFSFGNWYTSAEWDSLLAFYRNTLSQGTQPFTREHPRTKANAKFKWMAEPKITQARGVEYFVQHQMRSVP